MKVDTCCSCQYLSSCVGRPTGKKFGRPQCLHTIEEIPNAIYLGNGAADDNNETRIDSYLSIVGSRVVLDGGQKRRNRREFIVLGWDRRRMSRYRLVNEERTEEENKREPGGCGYPADGLSLCRFLWWRACTRWIVASWHWIRSHRQQRLCSFYFRIPPKKPCLQWKDFQRVRIQGPTFFLKNAW